MNFRLTDKNPGLHFKVLSNCFLTQSRFTDAVVKFTVSPDFPEEQGYCGEAHPKDGDDPQLDLFSYLVLALDERHKVCFGTVSRSHVILNNLIRTAKVLEL